MIVTALYVGKGVAREYQGRQVETAFFKYPVTEPVFLSKLGCKGDEQSDQVHHGGPDKAALLYAREHYAYWEKELGRDPGPSALGENLTVDGFTEESVCIGDVYQIGEATVQVSQPRVPCYKTNIRHGVPDMVERVLACCYTGIYVRVLKEGHVQVGDTVTLISRPAGAMTIMAANRLFHHDKGNVEGLKRLMAAEGLAPVWCEYVRRRLGAQ